MKVLVDAFNQKKALVGAFSVIVKTMLCYGWQRSVPKVVCGTGGAPVAKNSVCWTEATMVTMPGTK